MPTIRTAIGAVVLSAVVVGALAGPPATTRPVGARKITIGRDTTYITGPLTAEGMVDYAAALDALNAKGVTPANNAVVKLVECFGPEILGDARVERLKALGMKLPADGERADRWVKLDRTTWFQVPFKPWVPRNRPKLAEWLWHKREPLKRLVEASERPRYFM
ncbi:hypothetical protein LCGC14_2377680, partial [marine sediment metagenome]